MHAGEVFRHMLKHSFEPALASKGFRRKGNMFAKWVGQNCEVINFLRSPHSTLATYRFHVTLGIINRWVYWFEHGNRPPVVPLGTDLHWSARLDDFVERRRFWGWAIEKAEDADQAASEIFEALEAHGLPALDRTAGNDALLRLWSETLTTYKTGDIRPMLRLSVLAKSVNDLELSRRAVAKAVEACEGLPCARTVEAHITALENWRQAPNSNRPGKYDVGSDVRQSAEKP